MTFVASDWVPVLCGSPPCPPWSFADRAPGFNRDDGLIFVRFIVVLAILRPRIVLLENVSGMRNHSQWEVIVHLFAWASYKLKWVTVLDLVEVIPQHRERLLLIAVDQNAHDLELHDCQKWPVSGNHSLRSYHAIVELDCDWCKLTTLDREELQLYLSPDHLPKNSFGQNGNKRQKRDVTKYRLRTIDDVVGTFMTSYGFAKSLDVSLIQRSGVFGTLLLQGNEVRKFSVPEIAILQGVCEPIWLPEDLQEATFLLGNSIAVPHAAIAILNCLMMICPQALNFDMGSMFAKVCNPHIDASNLKVVPDGDGFIIDYDAYERVEHTLPMHEVVTLTVTCDVDTYDMSIEVGIHILGLMRFLTGKSIPADIRVCNSKYPDVSFPLTEKSKSTFSPVTLHVNVQSVLMIPPDAMFTFVEFNPWIVILGFQGILVVRVPPHPEVGDVYDAIYMADLMKGRDFVLTDVCRQRLSKGDRVPSCIFALSHGLREMDFFWAFEGIVTKRHAMYIEFEGPKALISRLFCFLDDLAMIELLMCLGWYVVTPMIPGVNSDSHLEKVVITRMPGKLSSTIADMHHVLISSVFRHVVLLNPEEKKLERVNVRIKCLDGLIIQTTLNHDSNLEFLESSWKKVARLFDWPEDIRFVVHGKTTNVMNPVDSYLWAIADKSKGITVHLVMPLHGGGPGPKNRPKHNDAQIPVKNATAGLLLSMGCDLQQTSTFVDKMLSSVGHVTLQQILKLQTEGLKWDALVKLARSMSIEIPNPDKAASRRFQQVQNKTEESKIEFRKFHASDFIIKKGFFTAEDGTACPQIECPVAGASGVSLMNPQQALPWLESTKKISSDELGAVILGKCPLGNNCGGRSVNTPGFDSDGRPVVLATCLHDLGEKQVQIQKEKSGQVAVSLTVVLAITAVREEIETQRWNDFVESPVRSALETLALAGCDASLQIPPWGRSWMCVSSKGKVAPKEADTMQFHIRVDQKFCHTFLKASGLNGIYVTAKDDNKDIDRSYRVVWVDSTLDQLRVNAAACPNNLGLVRIVKNGGRRVCRGIRFQVDHFDDAFSQLRPGVDAPTHLTVRYWAKLAPTPPGATFADVMNWIKEMGWPAKPIRPVGGSAWIIGASEKFTECFGMWNESTMLVHWLPPKSEKPQAVVLAGVVSRSTSTVTPASSDIDDPWANWKGRVNMTSTSNGSSLVKPPLAPVTQRTLDGPTEERFKKHDDQLRELQHTMQSVTDQLKLQQKQQESMQKHVDTEFAAVRHEVTLQCKKLEQSFGETLSHALSKQDKQMTDNFRELKAFLMETPLPAKKAKTTKPLDAAESSDL